MYCREFETNASELLERLYETDQGKSRRVLTRDLQTWNDNSVFEVAASAGLMDFMNNACCQATLSKMWNKSLPPEIAKWKVLY